MSRSVIGRRWLPLNALRAFEAVARHGSFTAAANALQVSQSALSRHVAGIETLIGVLLFDRRPHALSLTPAGERLLPAVIRAMDGLEGALNDVRRPDSAPLRTLRVQMPPTFATQVAVPLLREFLDTTPEIEIDVVSPYGVGAPLSGVDVAVVYARPMVTDLVTDLLWPARLSVLCHPALREQHAGTDLAGFIATNEIIHVRLADQPRHHLWTQFVRRQGFAGIDVERGLVFDTALLAVQYALSGDGIALIDPRLFRQYLADGRLVRPFEVEFDEGYGYYLLIQPEALGDAAIAQFRSWLIERMGTGSRDHPYARLPLPRRKDRPSSAELLDEQRGSD